MLPAVAVTWLLTSSNDAVVALRVLDAQLILDHPARGSYRLRKAAGHLQDTPSAGHSAGADGQI
jgi:hypothetical protein